MTPFANPSHLYQGLSVWPIKHRNDGVTFEIRLWKTEASILDLLFFLYHSVWEKPCFGDIQTTYEGSQMMSIWGLWTTLGVTLEADTLAPVELQMSVEPGDSLSAMSWENLSQNNPAKPLLDSWPVETVR